MACENSLADNHTIHLPMELKKKKKKEIGSVDGEHFGRYSI